MSGALAALLDMDVGAIEKLIAEQFRTKDTLIEPNVHALHLGRDYVTMNLEHPIGLQLKKANAVGDRIFIEGNSAAALGAVYGGATVCAWYPITPSSSLAEAFQRHCSRYRADGNKKNRYAIIQAEDELASIGMVIGAGWNGARAFTAWSPTCVTAPAMTSSIWAGSMPVRATSSVRLCAKQVDGQHVVQRAAGLALPDRGAYRPDDDRVATCISGHFCLL